VPDWVEQVTMGSMQSLQRAIVARKAKNDIRGSGLVPILFVEAVPRGGFRGWPNSKFQVIFVVKYPPLGPARRQAIQQMRSIRSFVIEATSRYFSSSSAWLLENHCLG
jgi:hypothetical protein